MSNPGWRALRRSLAAQPSARFLERQRGRQSALRPELRRLIGFRAALEISGHLVLRILKTGVRLKVLLHPDAVTVLKTLPSVSPKHFFGPVAAA